MRTKEELKWDWEALQEGLAQLRVLEFKLFLLALERDKEEIKEVKQ